ncbi:hypothetical protein, partial [Vibrio genomosp. F10]|uniref:hypothetical protein n=1 Tax=Vibrio genomosp. F10 TaxID=723171 RepID=UPI0005700F2C
TSNLILSEKYHFFWLFLVIDKYRNPIKSMQKMLAKQMVREIITIETPQIIRYDKSQIQKNH